MKRLIFALSMVLVLGLLALSWPGANAYAFNSPGGNLQVSRPATYQPVYYRYYSYYYTPYYDYYGTLLSMQDKMDQRITSAINSRFSQLDQWISNNENAG